ncbi:MAG: GntR family transcriptional regulator [Hyphomicrobiales bacterium]|nr:GntR family transcriptional regulator [Hyphomicrobiales bacterium]
MSNLQLDIKPIDEGFSLKARIYDSLKNAIMNMNIYDDDTELRLDERRLSEQFGISRTPLREALARLDQEGLVRIVPRRGIYIVRKSKSEILEMITVWAALESMAARLITQNASDDEIASLRALCSTFEGEGVKARIDEYSEANIRFHQAILAMSKNELLNSMAEGLFMHVRAIRARTIVEKDRADRSIVDHMHIIEALEARDTDLAERLVREHTLNLKAHVERYVEMEQAASATE